MTNMPRPIFITGSDYGGKGYVYDMLKRHPQVFFRHKAWYWAGYQPHLQKTFRDLSNPQEVRKVILHHLVEIHQENQSFHSQIFTETPEVFAENHVETIAKTLAAKPNHDTIFAAVMGFITQLLGKSFYMQLATGQYIQRLAKHLPEAKFLAVIRDPRNMLVSRKTRRRNVWTSKQFHEAQRVLKHHMTAYDPLWDSFSAKSDIRAMKRSLEKLPDQMRLYHHQALVEQPEKGAHNLCDFLQLPFDEALLGVERRSSVKWDAKKQEAEIPRYRRMLRPTEILLSQTVLKKELAWLGYPLDRLSLVTRALTPFLLFRSGFDLVVRVYRRWSYKGTGYIFDMFKMYMRRFRSIWRT